MTQSFLTFGVPFDGARVAAVEATVETQGLQLLKGGTLRDRLRRQGLHFMSITVVPGDPGKPAHLMIEMSVDDGDATAERILGDLLARVMAAILHNAGLAQADDVLTLLRRHRIRTGSGLFDVPGLDFCGTPGMAVGRILDEHRLVRRIRDILDEGEPPGSTPLARLCRLRDRVLGDALPTELHHLRQAEPVQPLPAGSGYEGGAGGLVGILLSAAWTLLWPVLVPLAALVVAAGLLAGAGGGVALGFATFVATALVALLVLAGLLGWLYARLRALERANQPDDSLPDPTVLEAVVAREDRAMQNHLAGISVMQPGWLRKLTLRLAFRVIGLFAARRFRPGFLGEIGTIHFARWVMLPGTDRLLFFSNYGGSWESYLEDFITKASGGLTGVWSNTVGFPATENLFLKGATDGDRFKRWARRQQRPTRFWYSAYPHLTTGRIRANAAIRHGLLTASTEDEAEAWFSLIGSSARPAGTIETDEVQTIFFGGLKRQPAGASLVCALPDDPAAARAWLRGMEPLVVFGEVMPRGTVHVLGLSASALHRLGLPDETLAEFPIAFRQGMAHPVRSRILADTGDDGPAEWLWGAAPAPDAVVNIYAEDDGALGEAIAAAEAMLRRLGGRCLHMIRMAPPSAPDGGPMREPFGFVDGVSQPVVRGTRRWVGDADAIHAVEPGEFLYGYPDNRGYVPPSPRVRASADPHNHLAVLDQRHSDRHLLPSFAVSGANADRDFGRNGSFMVIRQLEQDVTSFEAFLAEAARELKGRAGVPAALDDAQRAEWIGAKMVGRWKDGTSLVRFPDEPGTGWDGTRRERPDNDFLLGAEDRMGLRCPFGSHVRRTNPRESFAPGSAEQLSIVNRHRILRRGRAFDAQGGGHPSCVNPGLLFICLNLDLERQFEFIQQTWVMALQFHGLENEVDAILSRGGRSARLTIPTAEGPVTVRRVRDFVRVRGGGYFFMPGRRSLRYLAFSVTPPRQDGVPVNSSPGSATPLSA
jgi:Dyp-type peroxidase family